MKNTTELSKLIELEKIEENIYRGQSYVTPWGQVFGGQVLAQSLHAAYQTVADDRKAHSMHAYFILPGDVRLPIVYKVDCIRDGGSFTTRRVVAIQKGKAIFNMAASFQREEEGLDHQIPMPNVPPPEALITDKEHAEIYKEKLPLIYMYHQLDKPVEFRSVEKINYLDPKKHDPFRHVWIKAKGTIGKGHRTHQEFLAYASDYNLLSTAVLPHRNEITSIRQLQMASLDHAMWFHRDFNMDEWLLYAIDSPSASGARGFTRGNIFNRGGQLVASVVQEGLIRKRKMDS